MDSNSNKASKAVLNIPLSEYMELQERIATKDKEIDALQAALKTAQLADPENRIKAVYEALLTAIPLVGFAVSELPPESVRGWPYIKLAEFGHLLQQVPGMEARFKEQGHDFVMFAREVKPFEEARARGEIPPARTGGPG